MFYKIRARKSALYKSLTELKKCLEQNEVYAPGNLANILFICGANRVCDVTSNSLPSYRREKLISFIKKNIQDAYPLLAENALKQLQSNQGRTTTKNILNLEKELFSLSDYVLIVLESNSAFCELGAFSHDEELRKKLIVINDSKYKKSDSFINTGPLQLIANESIDAKKVFWYKMNAVAELDSVADVYSDLSAYLKSKPRKNNSEKTIIKYDVLSKKELLFISDLIYICGPILSKELYDIFKFIFGHKDFSNFKVMLAVLTSVGIVELKNGTYSSLNKHLFYQYRRVNVQKLKTSFKLHYAKEAFYDFE